MAKKEHHQMTHDEKRKESHKKSDHSNMALKAKIGSVKSSKGK